jgi:hypothetical protein
MQFIPTVKFRDEQFGAVLFETRAEKVFTLNPTAAAIVRELRTGTDESGVVERLASDFDAPAGVIARDVHTLVTCLTEAGLLT